MKSEKEENLRQRAQSRENAKAPPGTRRMENDEKAQMVQELEITKKELQNEIMKFPITMRTMAIQKRKSEMEDQLLKVEANLKTFSKDVVYVAM